MSYIAINYSRKRRTCGKCRTYIMPKSLHVEVINQRTTFVCAECVLDLSAALSCPEKTLLYRALHEGDISKSDISV